MNTLYLLIVTHPLSPFHRPFTIPQALRQGGRPQMQEENIEEEEDEKVGCIEINCTV